LKGENIMDINEIRGHWYASIYDKEETETDDIEFILEIIGNNPKKILEVCCGTGRILVPLAKSGHKVTGFDINEYMLKRIPDKIIGMNNIEYFKANALTDDWRKGYDIVVLAGNVMMNIETESNYEDAQKLFIKKASSALDVGGYILLDFALYANPEEVFGSIKEDRTIFEGYDDKGVYGKYILCNGEEYNKVTRMVHGKRRIELILQNGEKDTYEYISKKRIPTLIDIREWLKENNFEIEQEYGDRNKEPISKKTNRAIIYARKKSTTPP
jgi:SAM-dependent methyltransferase